MRPGPPPFREPLLSAFGWPRHRLGLLVVAPSPRITVLSYFGSELDVAHVPDVETPFVGLVSLETLLNATTCSKSQCQRYSWHIGAQYRLSVVGLHSSGDPPLGSPARATVVYLALSYNANIKCTYYPNVARIIGTQVPGQSDIGLMCEAGQGAGFRGRWSVSTPGPRIRLARRAQRRPGRGGVCHALDVVELVSGTCARIAPCRRPTVPWDIPLP